MKLLNQIPSWLLLCLSAVGAGLNAPGLRGLNLIGVMAYLPLLIVLDRIHLSRRGLKRRIACSFFCCWLTGAGIALLGTDGLVHSANVFGHFPWIWSVATVGIGYGLEVGARLFVGLVIPMLFIRRPGWWDLPFRLLCFVLADPLLPQLFDWTYGGFTFSGVPWIEQVADLVGDWGLGLYMMGFNLWLLLLWRAQTGTVPIKPGVVRKSAAIYCCLLALGIGYGLLRIQQIRPHLAEGPPLNVAAVQPNFSLQNLASNTDQTYSNRTKNLDALLADSQEALARFSGAAAIPKLVVWPESAYPYYYRQHESSRRQVEAFALRHHTAIVLTSLDQEEVGEALRKTAVAVLVSADGRFQKKYEKIALMPFGEYVPWGDELPGFKRWLKKQVPYLGLFTPGQEYTVFKLDDDIFFSGTICFDIFSSSIARNMVENGARLIINMSNLAWFGKTNTERQMDMMIRWRAIENRVPVLSVSNNGRTMFVNPLGESMGQELGLFEQGNIADTVILQKHFSFYRQYREWVFAFFAFLLLLSVCLAHARGRVFTS